MQPFDIRVLIIEDSRFFQKAVRSALEKRFHAQVKVASSYAEAKAVLAANPEGFDFALVDLILPDSADGEAVQHVVENKIPSIVFSSAYTEEFRERIYKMPIIDYLVKDSPSCIEALLNLIDELITNMKTKALVVDDSRTSRMRIKSLLQRHLFQVIEVEDAEGCLDILKHQNDIGLIITDYNMPGMNGADMVKKIRSTYSTQQLAIIGLSATASSSLSAKFVKYGANDFLPKDFFEEEFFCRIQQNMRINSLLDRLQKGVVTDYLTGIHNRAYFFEKGAQLVLEAQANENEVCVAMFDLDKFKQINDTFGHDAGDLVIKSTAQTLRTNLRATDIVVRMGGEEFAVILSLENTAYSARIFENLRDKIEKQNVEFNGATISTTCSIGVAMGQCHDLHQHLSIADKALYEAKENGRNQVHFASN